MRTAFVVRHLPPVGGGIGSYVEKTTRRLAARGHDVHVFAESAAAEPWTEIVERVTIHHLAPSRVRPNVLGRALAVDSALRRHGRFDLVQACEWGGEASVYALRRSAPLVTRLATPHYLVEALNDVAPRQRRKQAASRWLERLQTRHSDLVISPSRVLADDVTRAWRLRRPVRVVPTGITIPEADATNLPPELAGRAYVLYFGRLETRKGVDLWIDALPEVLTRHPDLLAVLVGEDLGFRGRPFGEYARERCGDLADRVLYLPQMDQRRLFPIIAGSQLVVMPSRWESLANACLEAMALGRPVLACSGSGFDEVITNGVDGFTVPSGDAGLLGQAAHAALSDPERLRRVGRAALERVRSYDLDLMTDRLLEAYRLLPGLAAA